MKRISVIALLVATGLLVGAGPAAALSCVELEPFDMEAAIADADAAAVGTIKSIWSSTAVQEVDANRVLTIEVTEVFKGSVQSRLRLHRSTSVWGPYYREGTELALLITDGVVRDGQDTLCGPFFSADDLRLGGGQPTAPQPPQPTWHLLDMAEGLVEMLAFIYGH